MNSHAHPASRHSDPHHRQAGRGAHISDYAPLAILLALTMLAAAAKQADYRHGWEGRAWMLDAMGFFLVVFSMFKFFNLSGFADGFQMYDLLAKRVRAYAFAYPFIELGLGLAYLARWQLPVVYAVTLGVMAFGALGVLDALRRKLDVDCACLGTVLQVPLSTVALAEDLGMVAMAAVMWAR